jgi:superfamily I DNA and/or RNA helicase
MNIKYPLRIIDEISSAITDEIKAVQYKYRQSPLYAENFKSLGQMESGAFFYQATVEAGDEGLGIPEGIEVRIFWEEFDFISRRKEQNIFKVTLLSFDPYVHQIIFSSQTPIATPKLSFKIEPLVDELLKVLRTKIVSLKNTPGKLMWNLLLRDFTDNSINIKSLKTDISLLDESQSRSVEEILQRKISFLWGPPGTGKTHTLAYLINELVCRNERVLVIAISNVAVDQIALKYINVHKQRALKNSDALRFGYPRLEEVRKIDVLFPAKERIRNIRHELNEAHTKLKKTLNAEERARLQQRIKELNTEIRTASIEPITKAMVTFTTAVQVCIEDTFSAQIYDTLIIDEASMLSAAYLAYLSSIPIQRLVIAGDYRQLSPIAIAQSGAALSWLHKDPFNISGLIGTDSHTALSMIYTQRRMHESICEIINDTFYFRRLRTKIDDSNRLGTGLFPDAGNPVVFIPITPLEGSEVKHEKSSRFNSCTADFAFKLVKKYLRNSKRPTIGVITPYRVQAQLIRNKLKELKDLPPNRSESIKVGTVHAFQGDESDIIIFDLVDNRVSGPGKLYQKKTGERLLNVAISRAKGKLIIIGDPQLFDMPDPDNKFNTLRKIFGIYFKTNISKEYAS